MLFTYTMEYYSALRKNEIMPFATTRMDLEDIRQSKMSHEKDKYHLRVESKIVNITEETGKTN